MEQNKIEFNTDVSTVTEKGYESESYSETEDDAQSTKQAPKDSFPAKPAAGNKSQKKTATNANKGAKQASIMGFFQKKWWRGCLRCSALLQTLRSLSVKCKHTTRTEEEWKSPPQKDFDDVNASCSG